MQSRNAAGQTPPSWKAFLERGIARCPTPHTEMKKLIKAGDFLTCCQYIKYKLGTDWVPFLEQEFLHPMYQPSPMHEAIFKLDSSIVLTPNFDKIYDGYANKPGNLLKVKKFYDEDIPRALRGTEKQRLILKVHGCIDTPDRLVFTREDYADIRNKHANFYKAMDALVLTHTFLFVGCGMNDPDLALVLEQYARSFGAAPPHYVTLPGKPSIEYARMLEKNYNLKILPYSAASGHKELLESIEGLVSEVETVRADLALTALW
jgi:hypothetical protein